jgi:hypothetical protein
LPKWRAVAIATFKAISAFIGDAPILPIAGGAGP